MAIPVRQRLPSGDPEILIEVTDDGSRTLVRRDAGGSVISSYHSGCGAAAECDWVYLRNGGMSDTADANWPNTILEVGFGSGLAMLRTLDRAIAADQRLHYVACETTPVDPAILQQLELNSGLRTPTLAEHFLDRWSRFATPNREESLFRWQIDSERTVDVHIRDARDFVRHTDLSFDTIYFDPFDPDVSPELWTRDVFEQLLMRLRHGGPLVTYCVKGDV